MVRMSPLKLIGLYLSGTFATNCMLAATVPPFLEMDGGGGGAAQFLRGQFKERSANRWPPYSMLLDSHSIAAGAVILHFVKRLAVSRRQGIQVSTLVGRHFKVLSRTYHPTI